MTEQLQIYKCEACGNIIEILNGASGCIVCCGKPMVNYEENSVDAAREKHVPVVEKSGNTVTVKVGSVAHPMTEEHLIEWIELIADGKAYRQFLKPGDAPEAVFQIEAAEVSARAYCNLHGLWRS